MNQIDSSKEQLFFSSVELNIFVYSNSIFTFREIAPNFIKKITFAYELHLRI